MARDSKDIIKDYIKSGDKSKLIKDITDRIQDEVDKKIDDIDLDIKVEDFIDKDGEGENKEGGEE
jgi:hypothetical protein